MGQIPLLNIFIFINNNTHLPNNNLLHNNPFGYLSTWLPQPKHFSPDTMLTILSPQYRTTIYNDGSPHQNNTYHISALLVLALRLAVNTKAGKRRVVCLTTAEQVSPAIFSPVLSFPRSSIINTAVGFWLAERNHVVQNVRWYHSWTSNMWYYKIQ